jgi:hypothetical protein
MQLSLIKYKLFGIFPLLRGYHVIPHFCHFRFSKEHFLIQRRGSQWATLQAVP